MLIQALIDIAVAKDIMIHIKKVYTVSMLIIGQLSEM